MLWGAGAEEGKAWVHMKVVRGHVLLEFES